MKDTAFKSDVYEPTFWHYLAIFPIWLLTKILFSTISFDVNRPPLDDVYARNQRTVGIAWHNTILILALLRSKILSQEIRMSGLVSASKDGAWLCAFFNLYRIHCIRGSSKRNGAKALIQMINALKENSDVFITPDGPRGPANIAKEGFLLIAKKTKSTILLYKITPSSYWRINKTWDKLIIPKPFCKIKFGIEAFPVEEFEANAKALNITPEQYVANILNSTGIDKV